MAVAIVPTVTTSAVSNITQKSAVCGGNVTFKGGSNVFERGICFNTTGQPILGDNTRNAGSDVGEFAVSLTNELCPGTTYYVRAYARNSIGTAYGDVVTFTTVALSLPTVSISEITNITSNSASCNGSLQNDGGGTVSSRGVCFNMTGNPTLDNSDGSINSGVVDGQFSFELDGLNPGTTYYACAYATNEVGIAYSDVVTFTTVALPRVDAIKLDFRFKPKGGQQNDDFAVETISNERTFLPIADESNITDGIEVAISLPSERIALLYQAIVASGVLQVKAFSSLDSENWNIVNPLMNNTHTVDDGPGIWGIDPFSNLFSKFLKLQFFNQAGATDNAVVSRITVTLQKG
jgi:hypothetical protein